MKITSVSKSTSERGAALVVGLILLVVISMMGAVAYGVATQQERISGNSRDRARALESAEAALRDCEAYLADPGRTPRFTDTGVYQALPSNQVQLPDTVDWLDATEVRVIASRIDGVAEQPACIIEELQKAWVVQQGSESESNLPIEVAFYRVTARGFGVRAGTIADLQSTFRRE